jgi:hypothetical protein
MSEARIGRFVAAALHESVAAHLPFRMEFYEHWLQPRRMQTGGLGVASFLAVLSFLRQEGEAYGTVVNDAGRHAADWVLDDLSPLGRLRWQWFPWFRRSRGVLRLAQRLAAESTPDTRCRIRWERGEGRLEVEGSPFCTVRTQAAAPLCGFYLAALTRFCERLGVASSVSHGKCRAMGAPHCTITLAPAGTHSVLVEAAPPHARAGA